MEPFDIENLTIAQARQIATLFSPAASATALTTVERDIPAHPYPVGSNVFIRTVTMHYTGKLVEVTAGELVLEDAAWIADSGRFSGALATGELNEVEPFPAGRVIVPRDGVIDVSRWNHDLPRSVK